VYVLINRRYFCPRRSASVVAPRGTGAPARTGSCYRRCRWCSDPATETGDRPAPSAATGACASTERFTRATFVVVTAGSVRSSARSVCLLAIAVPVRPAGNCVCVCVWPVPNAVNHAAAVRSINDGQRELIGSRSRTVRYVKRVVGSCMRSERSPLTAGGKDHPHCIAAVSRQWRCRI